MVECEDCKSKCLKEGRQGRLLQEGDGTGMATIFYGRCWKEELCALEQCGWKETPVSVCLTVW